MMVSTYQRHFWDTARELDNTFQWYRQHKGLMFLECTACNNDTRIHTMPCVKENDAAKENHLLWEKTMYLASLQDALHPYQIKDYLVG